MLKKAILGGTFNPVHWGHLLLAETALNQLALDQVIWVPAYRPLHKSALDLADFEQRLKMVELAIASHPDFAVSAVEQNFPGSPYAINTFLNLQALHPLTLWYWVIGWDAFQSLPHWYRWQELVDRCVWLVAPRWENPAMAQWNTSGCEQIGQKMAGEGIHLQWQILNMPAVGISSGLIRQYCGDRRSIRYLVPETVRHYILEQELYQH